MRDTLDRPQPLKTLFGKIINRLRTEPVALQGLVQAGLGLLAGFGLIAWTTEQIGMIMAFSAAALAFFTRRHVQPTARDTGGQPPDAQPAPAAAKAPEPDMIASSSGYSPS